MSNKTIIPQLGEFNHNRTQPKFKETIKVKDLLPFDRFYFAFDKQKRLYTAEAVHGKIGFRKDGEKLHRQASFKELTDLVIWLRNTEQI